MRNRLKGITSARLAALERRSETAGGDDSGLSILLPQEVMKYALNTEGSLVFRDYRTETKVG
jgi:hypothetical protein